MLFRSLHLASARSEGLAERDMESLRMMVWGLAAVESVGGALRVGTHGVMVVVGYDYCTRP